jgi:N-acetylglucosaminyldiphosphoundecaprenol N-acetyl-beta-D-mannosaminyltransferase
MKEKLKIISLNITHTTFQDCLDQVIELGKAKINSFVCFANVHMTVEAYKDKSFENDLTKATIITADGKPLAAACKWLYKKEQERIAGMDFMPALISSLNDEGASIFLYGSTEKVLETIVQKIKTEFARVEIAGYLSPPFRQLTTEEENKHIQLINESGAQFVLVALGCPKQEKWMAKNFTKINAVLLGVGGAFPVYANLQKRAPVLMQRYGLEWLYRLMQEPKRLMRRYAYTNVMFIYLLMKAVLEKKKHTTYAR